MDVLKLLYPMRILHVNIFGPIKYLYKVIDTQKHNVKYKDMMISHDIFCLDISKVLLMYWWRTIVYLVALRLSLDYLYIHEV